MKNLSNISTTGEASQNGSTVHGPQNGGSSTPHTMMNQPMAIMPMPATGAPAAVPGPTTNLNIGMDYWGAPAATNPAMRGKLPSTPVAGGIVTAGSRDNVQSQLWLQVNIVYFHIKDISFLQCFMVCPSFLFRASCFLSSSLISNILEMLSVCCLLCSLHVSDEVKHIRLFCFRGVNLMQS